LLTLILVLKEQPPVPMNNSVVFAGFAATNLATRIVDAQAKLVTTGSDARRQIVQGVWKESAWAIARRSELALLRRQVGSTIYRKLESFDL